MNPCRSSPGLFSGSARVRMNGGIQMDCLRQFMLPDPCPGLIVQIQLDISAEHASFSGGRELRDRKGISVEFFFDRIFRWKFDIKDPIA